MLDYDIIKIAKDVKAYLNQDFSQGLLDFVLASRSNDFKRDDFKLIKDNKGHEVFNFTYQNKEYYLKNYSQQGLKKDLKNLVRPVEAIRYFKISCGLLAESIPVVKPALAVEFRVNMLRKDSLFLTEGVAASNLYDFLLKDEVSQKFKEQAVKESAFLFAQLYQNNFHPGDPNLENILITDKQQELILVDVDNIKRYPLLPKILVLRNLAKFNALAYKNNENWNQNYREIFLSNCLKRLDFKQEIAESIARVDDLTVKRLINWDRKHIIKANPLLLDKFKQNK